MVGDGAADLIFGAGQGEEALERRVDGQIVVVEDVMGGDVVSAVV